MKIIFIITTFLLIIHLNGYGQIKQKLSFEDDFCFEKTNLDGEIYTSIKFEKLNSINSKGLPQLPIKIIKLVVPADATDFWIETNRVKTEEYHCEYYILPGYNTVPPDSVASKTVMYPILDSITKSELVYPENIVEVKGAGKLREFNIATVSIYPVQYYAAQDKVILYKDIDFTLHYKLNGSEITKDFKDKNGTIETMVKKYVKNEGDFKKFYKKTSYKEDITNNNLKSVNTGLNISCDYVIVTSDAYVPVLNEFVAWKKRKGIDIKVVTIDDIENNYTGGDSVSGIDDNAGKLRQFLMDTYNNSECFRYALFVGDNEIPIRYLQKTSSATSDEIYPSDYYFADFDTNWDSNNNDYYGESDEYDYEDYGPEIFIGRLMAQNAEEIKNWTRKVILYESDPGKGNPSYLTKAFLTTADNLDFSYIVNKLTWCSAIDTFYEFGGYNTTSTPNFPKGSDVINQFNNHYGIASFFAHGRPTAVGVATKGVNINDALSKYGVTSLDSYNSTSNTGCCLIPEDGNGLDNMTNSDYPTLYLSVSCETMPFDDYGHSSSIRNMGESYTVISKGGGPNYIGYTRDSYSPQNAITIGEILRLANDTIFYNIGKLIAYAKVFIVDYEIICQHGLAKEAYMLNLLGCPETELWTATPSTFNSASVSQNGNYVSVNTGGISNCKICLMSAYDNGLSYFDVHENVSSYTFPNVTMPYYVTITKHNKIPYLKNLTSVLFEDKTFSTDAYISCQTLSAGYSVDPNHSPDGNVVIASGTSVTFDATGDVLLDNGFEVELGATFEVK